MYPPAGLERKGGFNPDTVAFDDFPVIGGHPSKIAAIQIWADHQSVGGIQATYVLTGALKKGPPHVGTQGWAMPTQELQLDFDEYVTEISGSHSQIINQLTIRTTKGKILQAGGYGPQPFTLTIPPGQQAIALHGGTNGHLHNIGCHAAPIGGAGFGGPAGFGTQAPGTGYGGPQPGFGAPGFGGPQPGFGAPQGYGQPQPGVGGPPPAFGQPPPPGQPAGGFYGAPPVGGGAVQFGPEAGGIIHPDSRRFDLGTDAAKQGQLLKVSLLHNGKLVFGLATTTITNGMKVKSGYVGRLKNIKDPVVQKVTLALQPGEEIIEVSGRAGELIDNVTIRTSTGRSITGGGFGGQPFPNLLPPGRRLVAFHGTHGDCLHKIGIYYR